MKLDKIKFAKVVQYITECGWNGNIQTLDNLIDINVEPVSTVFVDVERVNELLRCMEWRLTNGGLIPAIKAYRALTNVGLKEAKETVEKYCVLFPDISPVRYEE